MDAAQKAQQAVAQFTLDRVLNQDQAGRRISLLGSIANLPALLFLERAPFPTSSSYLANLPSSLARLENINVNDIYSWHMAASPSVSDDNDNTTFHPDLKINLIYPCTQAHIRKYSKQGVRLVTETPEIYRDKVRPYMEARRRHGHIDWVFNIIDGRSEADSVIYRTKPTEPNDDHHNQGFLLLPDLNWDRNTLETLHLLALVERRDIWSLRDLKKKHVPWLEHIRTRLIDATVTTYPALESDQLKLYVHYQPTYYHFHIHIVHVALEAGPTQAVGKAVGLDSIIETLRAMAGDDDETGMDAVSMTYTVGEASELWTDVFEPLKNDRQQASRPRE